MSWRRLLVAGLTAAALAGLAGVGLERWWLGPTDATAAARVESLFRREFDGMTAALAEVAASIATNPAARDLAAGPEAARTLFDLLANVRGASPHPDDISVTVYDAMRVEARAWSGRPSDIPPERVVGPQNLFVTRSALGLRLVQVTPINGADGRRLGAVAVEHVLSRAAAGAAIALGEDSLPTSIAPVTLRVEGAGDTARDGTFLLAHAHGCPARRRLRRARDLQKTRAAWRRTVMGWVIVILGVTQLILIGPLLDARVRAQGSEDGRAGEHGCQPVGARRGRGHLVWTHVVGRRTVGTSAQSLVLCDHACGAGRAVGRAGDTPPYGRSPSRRAPRRGAAVCGAQPARGRVVAGLIVAFARVLAIAVDPATVDVRHFSLYPWNGARVLRLAGILALHVAALWAATLVLIAARGVWLIPSRSPPARLTLLTLWVAPTLVAGVSASMIRVAVADRRAVPLGGRVRAGRASWRDGCWSGTATRRLPRASSVCS